MNDTSDGIPAPRPAADTVVATGPALPTVLSRLKEAAAIHGEKALAELPATLRRIRTLLLVAAVSLPLFLVGVLVILTRLLH